MTVSMMEQETRALLWREQFGSTDAEGMMAHRHAFISSLHVCPPIQSEPSFTLSCHNQEPLWLLELEKFLNSFP